MSGIIMVECPFCGMVQAISTEHPVCCSCGQTVIEQDKEDEE
jgi:hypothetical protein